LYGGRLAVYDVISRLRLGHKRHGLRSLRNTNRPSLKFRAQLPDGAVEVEVV
jgi:hypothetical protein